MSLKITIPKPCHESWNGMTPDEKGRFCSLCAKSVVDFTAMPRADVEEYLLANSDKKVCARFNNSQIDNAPVTLRIPRQALYRQTSFRNIFLLALIVSMGTTLFSCQRRTIGEIAIPEDAVQADTYQRVNVPEVEIVSIVDPGDTLTKDAKERINPQGTTLGMVAPEPPPLMGDTIFAPVDSLREERGRQ